MIAYKFLGAGRVGLYSGFEWPLDEWVESGQPLEPGRRGIHGCRLEQLPYWIDDELWTVELGGETIATDRMVVAERGRLRERIGTWNAEVLRELAATALARRCHDATLLEEVSYWDNEPISTVYMAADSAGNESERAGRGYWTGFLAERGAQAAWLAGRLGLGS